MVWWMHIVIFSPVDSSMKVFKSSELDYINCLTYFAYELTFPFYTLKYFFPIHGLSCERFHDIPDEDSKFVIFFHKS